MQFLGANYIYVTNMMNLKTGWYPINVLWWVYIKKAAHLLCGLTTENLDTSLIEKLGTVHRFKTSKFLNLAFWSKYFKHFL